MVPWSTYTGTNLETADTAKEDLQLIGISSTRREAMSVQDRIDVVSFSFYGLLLNERRRETASLNHGVLLQVRVACECVSTSSRSPDGSRTHRRARLDRDNSRTKC